MSKIPYKASILKHIRGPADKFLKRGELIPFLFAIYPSLALVANNAREILISSALRPVILSLLTTVFILLCFRLLRLGPRRSSLATSWIVFLFFSYGHVYALSKNIQLLGEPLGRHRYLLPFFSILTVVGIWLILHKLRSPSIVVPPLYLVTVSLVLMSIWQLGFEALQTKFYSHGVTTKSNTPTALQIPEDENLPDIYYIVLDSYGRSDVINETYGYDNSGFIQELEKLGFFVATESISNYSYTILSLASSLNYAYLSDLGLGHDPDQSARDWYALTPLIQNSQIRRDLTSLGYSFVAFETGYRPTSVDDADLYFSPDLKGSLQLVGIWEISPLETMLIETTAMKILTDGSEILKAIKSPYDQHREMILFELDTLRKLPEVDRPKFVFAHIMPPHKPYVFGPTGEERNPTEAFTLADHDALAYEDTDRQGYVDQLVFTNRAILAVIKEILKGSVSPPVIIVQGDHGLPINDVAPLGRMAILNAFYLPQRAGDPLYPGISPVNTFRIVLNSVFDANLPILKDIGFYSRYPDLFDFSDPGTQNNSP